MPEREETVSSVASAPADSGRSPEGRTRGTDVPASVTPPRRVSPEDRRPPQSVLPPKTSDGAGAESPWNGVLVLAFLAASTAGVLVWKPGGAESGGERHSRTTPPRDGGARPADLVRASAQPSPAKSAAPSPAVAPPPAGR